MPLIGSGRCRRIAIDILVLVASLLLSLICGEVVVRSLAPQQLILVRPDIWRPLDTLGWGHRPLLDLRVNTGERTVRLRTDENGFRVGSEGRPDARRRILLLGDSFMAAMQVEHEQSLAGLIERCLAGPGGVAVWNTGVGGWDPRHYLLQADRALDRWPFDLVLVSVFLGNDMIMQAPQPLPPRQPVRRARFRVPASLDRGELIDALLAPVNDVLETRSHLFVLMKTRFKELLMRVGLTATYIPTELRRDEAESERWSRSADILASIETVAREHHVPTLFVLIPALEQVDARVLRKHANAFGIDPLSLDPDQADRLLSREGARRGLMMVSTTAALRAASARGLEPYGRIDTHLSPRGHRVVWSAIAERLAKMLDLDRPSDRMSGIGRSGPHAGCRLPTKPSSSSRERSADARSRGAVP